MESGWDVVSDLLSGLSLSSGLTVSFSSETSTTEAARQCENRIKQLPMSQLPRQLPDSTMYVRINENSVYANQTVPNQAPTAVPNSLQSVSIPLLSYNASPSGQASTVPNAAPQWSVAIVPANSERSSPFYQIFLKSKPKALGIVLIVSGVLEIIFGIVQSITTFSVAAVSGIFFWGPIFYIVAGSLTIAAHSKPNLCLVKGSLSLNIISSIFSFVAVILNIITLVIVSNFYQYDYRSDYRSYRVYDGAIAVPSFLLIINLFIFCVSLSLSIFGCRSISKEYPNNPQVFLIQNDAMVSMNCSTAPATFSGNNQPYPTASAPPPPPYTVQQVKAKHMP
ncbi:membrane-spanning 4-domains subfamily A member 8-like [Dendropsophus ebraccatus]|uniref:membrane-spanning 4-domains subfamily A member 8-like n=1 Tax=Dendropsophus ebraccatus TaxID=150705 RepID=UPI003831783A